MTEKCKACRAVLIEALDATGMALQRLKVALATIDLPAQQALNLSELLWKPAKGPRGDFEVSVKTDSLAYTSALDYVQTHDFVRAR
jgi:hypothetical protein